MPELEDQLRRYAEATESAVQPMDLADVPTKSSRRAHLALLAAAVVVVVAGAVALFAGLDSSGQGEHVTAEQGAGPGASTVPAGPQPKEGDGWRLLGSDRSGDPYRTGIATTDAQYLELWGAAGLQGAGPTVDFDTEVVIWFGAVYRTHCDIRMDDVISDTTRKLVHAVIVIPRKPRVCGPTARPKAYVVALRRDGLPEPPFSIQLGARDPGLTAPYERTVVRADLSSPGAVVPDDQTGVRIPIDEVGPGPLVGPGAIIYDFTKARYDLDLSCDIDVVGPFNGGTWRAVKKGLDAHPPRAWTEAAGKDGVVRVELFIQEAPSTLALTANGHSETYEPAFDDAPSNCR